MGAGLCLVLRRREGEDVEYDVGHWSLSFLEEEVLKISMAL